MGTVGDGLDGRNSAGRASPEPVHLAGAGTFALEIADWARAAGHRVVALIELVDPGRPPDALDGIPVVGAGDVSSTDTAVLAAGGDRRARWATVAGSGCAAGCVVHPGAHVSPSAVLGAGCVVGPGAVVGAHASLGEHVLLSRGALVGHHTSVGAFTSVLPGANVAGHVVLGTDVVVGMGSVVVDHVSVGPRATIAAGAAVLRDVAPGVRVQGVPAREFTR